MRRFISSTLVITFIVAGFSVLFPQVLFGGLPYVSAEGVGGSTCVSTPGHSCSTDTDTGSGADASASGSSGSDAGGSGGSVNNNAACSGLDQLGGVNCSSNAGQAAVGGAAERVVSIISYLAGVVAVIMIMVSGFRYMTSDGDSAKVSTAKTALIYALIGLAVAALAQILVRLVLNTSVSV